MKKRYEYKYHSLEDTNWWFCSRRNIILKFLKRIPTKSKILDIGCSSGILINLLRSRGYKNTYGIDISRMSVYLSKKKGIKNVYLKRGEKTGFPENKFDIVICSDVLEHIKNEKKAVLEWRRILKMKGKIICFTPAFNFLWSSHDIENMHYRRYSKNRLCSLFKKNGYSIIRSSYWNSLLFFPMLIIHFMNFILSKSSSDKLYLLNRFSNSIIFNLLKVENTIISKGIDFPFGISVFIIAEKI